MSFKYGFGEIFAHLNAFNQVLSAESFVIHSRAPKKKLGRYHIVFSWNAQFLLAVADYVMSAGPLDMASLRILQDIEFERARLSLEY